MGGMCLCRTCLFSSYLRGSSRQDALGPCERQISSLPWPSEPWTMPIQELHCIIDGDTCIVMAGPRYRAVVRAASSSYAGELRSIIDCRACPADSSSFCVPSCPAGFWPLSPLDGALLQIMALSSILSTRALLLPDVVRLA